jgi:hypothetical protein
MSKVKVSVVVPSTRAGVFVSEARMLARAELVAKNLSDRFGGATATPSSGYWVNDAGKLVEEKVVVVYTYTDALDEGQYADLRATVKGWQEIWVQDCVLLTVEPAISVDFVS